VSSWHQRLFELSQRFRQDERSFVLGIGPLGDQPAMHRISDGSAMDQRATWRRLSNTVPSALTAVYAVRSTMTALGAHVGAKVQRAVAWVRLHKLDDHRSFAHGTMRGCHGRQPLFRSHVTPLSRTDPSRTCEIRCSRGNQGDQKRGDNDRRDEPAHNLVTLRPARGTAFILPPGDCCRWSTLNVGNVCHARIWVRQ
jgi:hypothetical protein